MENVQRPTFNVQRSERNRANGGVYDLEGRLLNYAADIVRLTEKMPQTRSANHIAGQLLRSGTSPLPNHGEAQAAESRRWHRLIITVPLTRHPESAQSLVLETEELIRIFAKSINTAKAVSSGRSKLDVGR